MIICTVPRTRTWPSTIMNSLTPSGAGTTSRPQVSAPADAEWLTAELDRESRDHGIRVRQDVHGTPTTAW
jgi:hypothetical protein